MASMQKMIRQMQGEIKILKIKLLVHTTKRPSAIIHNKNKATGGSLHTDGHMESAATTEKPASKNKRGKRRNSKLLAYEQWNGTFNYNRNPMALPGTRTIVTDKLHNISTW